MGAGLFDEIDSLCVFCRCLAGVRGEENTYLGVGMYLASCSQERTPSSKYAKDCGGTKLSIFLRGSIGDENSFTSSISIA